MREIHTVFTVQRGNSSTLRLSRSDQWAVSKECWESGRLLSTRLIDYFDTAERAQKVAAFLRRAHAGDPAALRAGKLELE